jgi:hypothetical protein
MPDASTQGPLALEALALRYAANDLPAPQAAAFESLLATDQTARDALSEAVRLSAAALGQAPPAPDSSFRAAIRDRLRPLARWCPRWLARRAYRGHPVAWVGLGLVTAATAALTALAIAERPPGPEGVACPPAAVEPTSLAGIAQEPPPGTGSLHPTGPGALATGGQDATLKEAEIWAELSTTEHVEKAHEDEARWRHLFRGLHPIHSGRPIIAIDSPMP